MSWAVGYTVAALEESETLTLTPAQKRRLARAFALFFVFAAVGVVVFTFWVLGSERRRLDSLSALSPDQWQGVEVGREVLFTGTVAPSNSLLVDTLVVGCEEEEYDNDTKTTRTFNQPIAIEHGGVTLLVELRQPCPRGSHETIQDPDAKMRRRVGYGRGARLTVVGSVLKAEPLVVRAEDAFGGDVAAYRRYLTKTRWYSLPFAGLLLLVAGLIWFGAGRRPRPRDTGTGESSFPRP